MLEATLEEAGTLKKLLDAIKELVTDANFECNDEGINLQAMDNSHVALVAVLLQKAGFSKYRCDRPMPLGVNLTSLTKVLRCAKDDDRCTLKAADEADVLNLVYEAKTSDRIAEYDMKLMDIDSDTLGIPDTEYDARVTMPSAEFTRIVRDLSQLGESVRIEVSKEGVRFASEGEAANGNVLLKHTEGSAAHGGKISAKSEEEDEPATATGESSGKGARVKMEKDKGEGEDEDDVEMDEGDKDKEGSDDGEEEVEEDERARKRRKNQGDGPKAKKARTTKKGGEEGSRGGVTIEMNQHVSLTFSLKYLVNFSKSASLCTTVQLMMSNDVPLLVSYDFGQGHIRYYLAPKIGDD